MEKVPSEQQEVRKEPVWPVSLKTFLANNAKRLEEEKKLREEYEARKKKEENGK